MKPLIFVALAFLVGCNGMGSGANRFLPGSPGAVAPVVSGVGSASGSGVRTGSTKLRLTITIPKRHRREPAAVAHPASISSLTQSISIAINGAGAHVFNATPSSPECKIGPSGTVCSFLVDAPIGADTFVIATYSGVGGGGAKLDQGSAVFNVVKGKSNAPSVKLGPVVSTTADSGVGSLRFAIGAANAGDTIMLLLPAGSKIVLGTPITISNRISIAGPGVKAGVRRGDKRADTTYAGISVSGNGAQQIFSIQAGATVTISGLILTQGNAAAGPGGAVNNAGTLTLANDVLFDNTSTAGSPLAIRAPHAQPAPKIKKHGHKPARQARLRHPHCSTTYIIGGAVYNNGTMIVSGTTFDGNTVNSAPDNCAAIFGYGGAVFNDTNGQFFSTGNTYTNNAAYSGGAVYNYADDGQASFTGDTFNANLGCTASTGCATSGCTTTCTSRAYGEGAAIYDDSGPGVTITSSVFEKNVAGGPTADSYGAGGALYLDEGSPTITGSTFTNNLAGGGSTNEAYGEGGAIYWCGSSAGMHLSDDTFTSNQAGGDDGGEGGAVYACDPFSGNNITFTGNVAFGKGSAQTGGDGEGGAVYADDGMALTTVTFKQNVATGSNEGEGGALYLDDASTLAGCTFTENSAIGTSATGSDSYAEGGAIYTSDGLSMSSDSFTSNTAVAKGTYAYEAYGGAIYSDDALISSHDTYTSNGASAIGGDESTVEGGAVFSYEPLTLTFDSFAGNSATGPYDAYGGALYSDDTSTAISNSSFTANSANGGYEGYGGGIYDNDGLNLSGSVISGNTATHRGGGIYADGTETVANVTISGNKVTGGSYEDGGGGYYSYSSLVLTNSTISGNSATVNGTYAGGGGLYSDGSLSISGSTISGNAVLGSPPSSSGGGGMFLYDGGTILNSTVTGNSSSRDGGGLLNDGTSLTLTNVTLFQNAATSAGGNVANTDSMTMGSSIAGTGSASSGPDVSNTGTLTSNDYNVISTAVAGTALSGTTTHDQQISPLLLALTNNAGPTLTNADVLSSPGRAAIPFAASTCNGAAGTNVDQRGFTRGAGGRCDVGAYEFAGVASSARHAPPPPTHGSHGHAPHGKSRVHTHRSR